MEQLRPLGFDRLRPADRQTVVDFLQRNGSKVEVGTAPQERLAQVRQAIRSGNFSALRRKNLENILRQKASEDFDAKAKKLDKLNFDVIRFLSAVRGGMDTLPMKGGEDRVRTSAAAQQIRLILGLKDASDLFNPKSRAFARLRVLANVLGATADTPDAQLADAGITGTDGIFGPNSAQVRSLLRSTGLGIKDDSYLKLYGRSFDLASSPSRTLRFLAGDQRREDELDPSERIVGEGADILAYMAMSGGLAKVGGGLIGRGALKGVQQMTMGSAARSALGRLGENTLFAAPGLAVRADDIAKQDKSSFWQGLEKAGGEHVQATLRGYDPRVLFDPNASIDEKFHNLVTLGFAGKDLLGHVKPIVKRGVANFVFPELKGQKDVPEHLQNMAWFLHRASLKLQPEKRKGFLDEFRGAAKSNKGLLGLDAREVFDAHSAGGSNAGKKDLSELKLSDLTGDYSVGRGKKAILDRLKKEWEGGGLNFGDDDQGYYRTRDFLESMPDKVLENLKLLCTYDLMKNYTPVADGLYAHSDRVLVLSRYIAEKTQTSENTFRTVVHEIAHHLQHFLTQADVDLLKRQYMKEVGRRSLHKGAHEQRWESLSEWWAYTIEDAVTRKVKMSEIRSARPGFERSLAVSVALAQNFYVASLRFLQRGGKKDQASRLYNIITSSGDKAGFSGNRRLEGRPDGPGSNMRDIRLPPTKGKRP